MRGLIFKLNCNILPSWINLTFAKLGNMPCSGGDNMKLPPIFTKYKDEIEAELHLNLADFETPLYRMMRYHLGWEDELGNPSQGSGGKRLRPSLCLLACEASGSDAHRALPAAAAVELIHNFSLIHDDIQDGDPERHHRPTVWKIWGKPQAINAGTAMRILANQALFRLVQQGETLEKHLQAQRLLDLCTLRLIEGQYLDISFENRIDIGLSDYLDMVAGKTAALIACSLELGALVGTSDPAFINSFKTFGVNIGFAFQIRDDILGIWGAPEKTGKSNGSDILRRKKSFPILYALEKSTGKAHAELVKIYQRDTVNDRDRDKVLNILDGIRADEYTQQEADNYCNQAMSELVRLGISPLLIESFNEIAEFLTNRDY
jgi:geranylgeranyl diphosphate synthase type I